MHLTYLVCEGTYITPSSDDIQKIVSTEWKIYDALIDSLAASLGCQIFFRDLRPTQGSHSKSDWLVPTLGVRSGRIASSSEKIKREIKMNRW